MSRIIIILEGGLVQSILSDSRSIEVYKIDYDTNGADPSLLTDIPQIGLKTTSPAFACEEIPEIASGLLMSALIEAVKKGARS
jgi:hypothetical protein